MGSNDGASRSIGKWNAEWGNGRKIDNNGLIIIDLLKSNYPNNKCSME
jgi:hypothetical protein